jgi:hypothetical protein
VTRHEAVLQAIVTRLVSSGAVAAGRVHRDRGDAIPADQLPAIDVRLDRSAASEYGSQALRHELSVRVDIHAREAAGQAPSTVADAALELAHRALCADPTLGGVCRRMVLDRQDWRYQGSGDGTLVVVESTYTATHTTRSRDLAAAAV